MQITGINLHEFTSAQKVEIQMLYTLSLELQELGLGSATVWSAGAPHGVVGRSQPNLSPTACNRSYK